MCAVITNNITYTSMEKRIDVIEGRDSVVEKKRQLRNKHCSGRPGKASDYTYVITGTCRARPGTPAHRELLRKQEQQQKERSKKGNGKGTADESDTLTPVENLRELRKVVDLLKTDVEPQMELSTFNYAAITPLFDMMVDAKLRKRYRDPVRRFAEIVTKFKRNISEEQKRNQNISAFNTMPRYTVFTLLLSHLQNLRLPPDSPTELTKFHPIFPKP